MWIGWLFVRGQWAAQPSTRSPCLGTCSARLGELARAAGLPATHEMMTAGRPPIGIVPPEHRVPSEDVAPDLEVEDL